MKDKSSDGKKDLPKPNNHPKVNGAKLDKMLSAICKAGGMTGGSLSDLLRGGGLSGKTRSGSHTPGASKGGAASENREREGRRSSESSGSKEQRFQCKGPCVEAEWRAHLDIPEGLICLSAAWSRSRNAQRHRDVTLGVNYLDNRGRPQYEEMTFCDSEIRWIMETLWHAPIWD